MRIATRRQAPGRAEVLDLCGGRGLRRAFGRGCSPWPQPAAAAVTVRLLVKLVALGDITVLL